MEVRRRPRIPFAVEILSYRELDYYLAADHEALILIQDPDRFPTRVPRTFERQLRLRIPLEDLGERTLDTWRRLKPQAVYAIGFARRHGAGCRRMAICSPDGEIRAPGLAAGLMGALDFPTWHKEDFARLHPRLSTTLRDRVLEAAGKLPPSTLEKAASSPLTKAALLLLARFTEGRLSS